MKILICDDNSECIKDVQEHIKIFSMDTGIEFEEFAFSRSIDVLNSDSIFDIAILDVEMDDVNGLKLGEFLRKSNPHIILIYLTAHKKYLDDALNLNAVRFFEKPIEPYRFYKGLNDAIERIDNSVVKFALKDKGFTDVVNSKDIIFVEIEHRHSKVVTINKIYHSSEHISFWREKLQSSAFAVPHRSYIVNMNYISTYQRARIWLNNSNEIPVAKSQQASFYQRFCRFLEGR
ncbi:MAG: response regulator transcription factor [Clostridia bacterium]|nr:response regulator transcription factor [Clostridia bacterium]